MMPFNLIKSLCEFTQPNIQVASEQGVDPQRAQAEAATVLQSTVRGYLGRKIHHLRKEDWNRALLPQELVLKALAYQDIEERALNPSRKFVSINSSEWYLMMETNNPDVCVRPNVDFRKPTRCGMSMQVYLPGNESFVLKRVKFDLHLKRAFYEILREKEKSKEELHRKKTAMIEDLGIQERSELLTNLENSFEGGQFEYEKIHKKWLLKTQNEIAAIEESFRFRESLLEKDVKDLEECIVLQEVYNSTQNRLRFLRHIAAHSFCARNRYQYITIPRVYHDKQWIIEEKIPLEDRTISAIGFYLENYEKFQDAAKEFASFLCQYQLDDICNGWLSLGLLTFEQGHLRLTDQLASDGEHFSQNYAGCFPFYPNVSYYIEEGKGKLACVDLRNCIPLKQMQTRLELIYSLKRAIHFFPHFWKEIAEVGQSFDLSLKEELEDFEQEALSCLQLFTCLYTDRLAAIRDKGISIQEPWILPELTYSKRQVIKQFMLARLQGRESSIFETNALHVSHLFWSSLSQALKEQAKQEPIRSSRKLVSLRVLIKGQEGNGSFERHQELFAAAMVSSFASDLDKAHRLAKVVHGPLFEAFAKAEMIRFYSEKQNSLVVFLD